MKGWQKGAILGILWGASGFIIEILYGRISILEYIYGIPGYFALLLGFRFYGIVVGAILIGFLIGVIIGYLYDFIKEGKK